MPRYTRQHDKFRCGPVAIANALKWAGAKFNYRRAIPTLDILCKTVRQRDREERGYAGTRAIDLHDALKQLTRGHLKVVYHEQPGLRAIQQHLRYEGAVVLRYTHTIGTRRVGHYQLFTDYDPETDTFEAINARKGRTRSRLTRENLRKEELKFRRRAHCAWDAWFLTRKGD